jgi:hypothetical protein
MKGSIANSKTRNHLHPEFATVNTSCSGLAAVCNMKSAPGPLGIPSTREEQKEYFSVCTTGRSDVETACFVEKMVLARYRLSQGEEGTS